MAARLPGIEACVFDAYGTLFDLASATRAHAAMVGARLDQLARVWRQKQLEYTWLRTLMGVYADFWQVTGEALDFALADAGVEHPAARDRLLNSYLELAVYPEVSAMLARLTAAGLRCAILSNGSPAMLQAVVERTGCGKWLEAVLSVDQLRVYKPHPSVYRSAVDRLGVAAERICFVSGNGWDVAGAAQFGLRVVWVNRAAAPPERLPAGPEIELPTLAGLPAALGIA
jgi:2-haloacid dehalogenase